MSLRPGDKVMVTYGATAWYVATVLNTRPFAPDNAPPAVRAVNKASGRRKSPFESLEVEVHYDGWAASCDEWRSGLDIELLTSSDPSVSSRPARRNSAIGRKPESATRGDEPVITTRKRTRGEGQSGSTKPVEHAKEIPSKRAVVTPDTLVKTPVSQSSDEREFDGVPPVPTANHPARGKQEDIGSGVEGAAPLQATPVEQDPAKSQSQKDTGSSTEIPPLPARKPVVSRQSVVAAAVDTFPPVLDPSQALPLSPATADATSHDVLRLIDAAFATFDPNLRRNFMEGRMYSSVVVFIRCLPLSAVGVAVVVPDFAEISDSLLSLSDDGSTSENQVTKTIMESLSKFPPASILKFEVAASLGSLESSCVKHFNAVLETLHGLRAYLPQQSVIIAETLLLRQCVVARWASIPATASLDAASLAMTDAIDAFLPTAPPETHSQMSEQLLSELPLALRGDAPSGYEATVGVQGAVLLLLRSELEGFVKAAEAYGNVQAVVAHAQATYPLQETVFNVVHVLRLLHRRWGDVERDFAHTDTKALLPDYDSWMFAKEGDKGTGDAGGDDVDV
jgi:hypothetical protein